MFKKVLSLLALEVFLIIGFNYEDVKCFAATDFSDVPISHMYYEDITYMRENGYVSGYGDNTFKPDRDVTLLETAVMLKNIDGEKASQPLPYCFSEGLIPLEIVSKDPYTKLNRAEIYNILFDYFQVNVYHLDTSKTIYDIYLETAIKLGLCSEDAKLNDYISRGEFSFLVNSLKNNTIVLDTPEWLKDFPIISSDGLALSKYYKYLDSVPHVILEEFKNRNWTLDISPSNVRRLNTEQNIMAVGWTDYLTESVFIMSPASIVHEMGHFLEGVLMFPIDYIGIYETDANSFVKHFMNCNNIPDTEYFATYFDKYISSKNDIELAEELKVYTPTSYEYFVELEQNNWSIR